MSASALKFATIAAWSFILTGMLLALFALLDVFGPAGDGVLGGPIYVVRYILGAASIALGAVVPGLILLIAIRIYECGTLRSE